MNKKTSVIGVSLILALAIGIVSSGIMVEAAPPKTQTVVLPKALELTPVASVDGYLFRNSNAELYYGSQLCGISSDSEGSVYIQFATDTLVKHGVETCRGIANDLDLANDVDANFKTGDVLVLKWYTSEPQRWIEVYREQTQ
jgi:hypothetical protein